MFPSLTKLHFYCILKLFEHQLQDKYVPTGMYPVGEEYFRSRSKSSGTSLPHFMNFHVERKQAFTFSFLLNFSLASDLYFPYQLSLICLCRGIFCGNIRLYSCGMQENPRLHSILVPSQQVPFQKKRSFRCSAFKVTFKVLHEKV